MNEDILYIWLSLIPGIGAVLGTELINHFSNIKEIYNANYTELLKTEGIGSKLATAIDNKDLTKAKEIYKYCIDNNILLLKKKTNMYPKQLNNFKKSPVLLYAKGVYKDFEKSVAVVGARRCTDYGKTVAIDISEKLSRNNVTVISGLAKGIDGYAHAAAVKNNGYTVAIIGTGIDICYPSEHKDLMGEIMKNGVIISQFPPGTRNVKQNFIRRNETIAMLADKVIVVQASEKSGAIYTAEFGLKCGKEVLAVPNNIYDHFSLGSNNLLLKGAKAYINSNSIIEKVDFNKEIKEENIENIEKLNTIQQEIYEIIKKQESSLDRIKLLMKNKTQNIEEEIFDLELQGKVKQVAGMWRT